MNEHLNISKFNNDIVNNILSSDQVRGTLLAKFLAARSIVTKNDIFKYLNPNIEIDWDNPYNIFGMEDVANAIESAIRHSKKILIYGDFDVDGISSVSLLLLALREIRKHTSSQFSIDYYIPDRFKEGYGFSSRSVSNILNMKNKPDFIITVDCGITAKKELTILQENDIEVVVTDHHEVSNDYPDNVYLIDPKAEKNNISANLSGSGVVLKLIEVLGSRFGMPFMWLDFIDIACLGTIADIMPLTGQNRSLVYTAINSINFKPRVSIKAMLDVIAKIKKLSSQDIAFYITPRLNSSGRLNIPSLAVKLLTSENYIESYNLALEIENLNNKRKNITEDVFEDALHQAEEILAKNKKINCLVLYKASWHDGVRGIVAAKIASQFNLPTIVCNLADNNIICGSGRSVGSIDLHDACMKCFNNYIKFGGHKNACGLSIHAEEFNIFYKNLNCYLNTFDKSLYLKELKIDAVIKFAEISIESVEELKKIEPVGQQNEEAIFLSRNVFLKNIRIIGKDKNHLLCILSDGLHELQGIMFFVDNINFWLNCKQMLSVVYTPKVEEFNCKKSIKLYIKKFITYSKQEACSEDDIYILKMYEKYSKISDNKSLAVNMDSAIKDNNIFLLNKNQDTKENNTIIADKRKFKSLDNADLQNTIICSMIGKNAQLHHSQKKCLDLLKLGKSILAVMPTGRGKSLIFQVYATYIALKYNKTSIFVYPLRALISDQAYHLKTSLKQFGINIKVITGETDNTERKKIYSLLYSNSIDILLTTPEYLSIHKKEFSNFSRIGFIVIDECHHLGEIRVGQRTAYGHLPKILNILNNPQVLALSATVNKEVYLQIKNYLPIEEIVEDNFERANLYIDDRRNLSNRDDYLVSLVSSKQKTLVYVNSRQQTVDLARMIKSRATHIALKIGFYNAGMTREMRNKIENMFRENKLIVLVATSAFGEGVNIPDVRHVCLYHLPFSDVEFNQMCGRCGRDNNDAIVHLLYNSADANINASILSDSNPNRIILGKIYLWIKSVCIQNSNKLNLNHQKLLDLYINKKIQFSPSAVMCALDIFKELELLQVETSFKDASSCSIITLNLDDKKVILDDSSRYCEGQNELDNFRKYNDFAMKASSDKLTDILRHPILPR